LLLDHRLDRIIPGQIHHFGGDNRRFHNRRYYRLRRHDSRNRLWSWRYNRNDGLDGSRNSSDHRRNDRRGSH
jgi:hypothetical protein